MPVRPTQRQKPAPVPPPPAITEPMFPKPDGLLEETVEYHAHHQKTPIWLFKAARVAHHWPEAKQMSRDEFNEIVAEIANGKISY